MRSGSHAETPTVYEDLLRLAARAEYDDHPPEEIRAWLQSAGVAA